MAWAGPAGLPSVPTIGAPRAITITSDVVETLLPKIPNRKALAVDAVMAAAASINLAPDPSDDRKKFKAALEQSKAFSELFK